VEQTDMDDATSPLFSWPQAPAKACPDGGIYRISGPGGKVYIGSSEDVPFRWNRHQTLLRAGRHHNNILQRAWDKHGEDAFTFEVVERVGLVADLVPAEQRHLDAAVAAGPVYNLALDVAMPARGLVHTPESRLKMSESIKASMTPERLAAKAERVRGESNPGGKLTEAAVREVCGRLVAGEHPQDLGAEYGVTEFTIYQIRCGRIWTHVATPEMVAAMMAVRQNGWDKRTVTDEHRERLRALGRANEGREVTEETRAKLAEHSRGELNPKAKLTEAKVAEIKGLLARGVPGKELAARFGVGANTISRIKTGESWGYVQPAPPLTT
jgi:hypothetical protein